MNFGYSTCDVYSNGLVNDLGGGCNAAGQLKVFRCIVRQNPPAGFVVAPHASHSLCDTPILRSPLIAGRRWSGHFVLCGQGFGVRGFFFQYIWTGLTSRSLAILADEAKQPRGVVWHAARGLLASFAGGDLDR